VVEIHGLQLQKSLQNDPKIIIAGIFYTEDNEKLWAIFPQEDVMRLPNLEKLLDAGSELLGARIQSILEKQN
jgi:hypothetical protein